MSLAPHVLVPESLASLGAGALIALPASAVHHLRRSLRRGDGSALTLTDGQGARATAELTPDGARLDAVPSIEPRRTPQLVLAQSLAKGRRADDAVRMACELSVDRIVPVVAERTQGRPDDRAAAAVVDRWRAVAVAALEQSRGVHLPDITACRTSEQLAGLASDVRLVAVPGAPGLPEVLECHMLETLEQRPAEQRTVGEVCVAVGPEGGWSDQEVTLLTGSGWLPVGLGPSVLRTEHAGPIAIAVLAALCGHWRAADEDTVRHAARDRGPSGR